MDKKPYEVFDENKNLMISLDGYHGGSSKFNNYGFSCSQCLKYYFMPQALKKHRCNIGLIEGINFIDKNSPKKFIEIASRLGSFSAQYQRIDFPMTHTTNIRDINQRVLVLVHNLKILGFLTYSKRKFKQDGSLREYYSIDDIFVFEYAQRGKQGLSVGTILFDSFIKDIKLENIDEIIEKVTICKPSEKMREFLIKKGLGYIREWR